MKSLREYFDVYEVTAVSFDRSCTAFSARNDSIQYIDTEKAVEYAKKAIDKERIDDATIVILVPQTDNEPPSSYGIEAFCYQSVTDSHSDSDIPTGCSVSYVPLPLDANMGVIKVTDSGTLLHEAIGHGFAKLADETSLGINTYGGSDSEYPKSDKECFVEEQKFGYGRNISFDSDVTKSYWADFAADSRYDLEKLGCYEGALHHGTGVYRPTEYSIMRGANSTAGFNVASRVMIYKRCMKIAYGDSWKFDYEEFVKFDLIWL